MAKPDPLSCLACGLDWTCKTGYGNIFSLASLGLGSLHKASALCGVGLGSLHKASVSPFQFHQIQMKARQCALEKKLSVSLNKKRSSKFELPRFQEAQIRSSNFELPEFPKFALVLLFSTKHPNLSWQLEFELLGALGLFFSMGKCLWLERKVTSVARRVAD